VCHRWQQCVDAKRELRIDVGGCTRWLAGQAIDEQVSPQLVERARITRGTGRARVAVETCPGSNAVLHRKQCAQPGHGVRGGPQADPPVVGSLRDPVQIRLGIELLRVEACGLANLTSRQRLEDRRQAVVYHPGKCVVELLGLVDHQLGRPGVGRTGSQPGSDAWEPVAPRACQCQVGGGLMR